jgi:hypothetical protein
VQLYPNLARFDLNKRYTINVLCPQTGEVILDAACGTGRHTRVIMKDGVECEAKRSKHMAEAIIEGGCLCGAIRYRATGAPYNITYCHCRTCRRASGAAFVSRARFSCSELGFYVWSANPFCLVY